MSKALKSCPKFNKSSNLVTLDNSNNKKLAVVWKAFYLGMMSPVKNFFLSHFYLSRSSFLLNPFLVFFKKSAKKVLTMDVEIFRRTQTDEITLNRKHFCANVVAFVPLWPDWSKFRHFGKSLGNFWGFLPWPKFRSCFAKFSC